MNTNIMLLQFIGTNLTAASVASTNVSETMAFCNELAKAWGPICVGFLAVLTTFVGQLLLIRRQRLQFESQSKISQEQFNRQLANAQQQFERQNAIAKKQLGLSKSEKERAEIQTKLNSFYGPLRELRTESVSLYRRFAVDLQEDFRKRNMRFRTLRFLLQGGQFKPQDQELLNQILVINDRILELVERQSGVVDNPELQDLLGTYGAHIRILKLASEGKLSGPSELFEDIVFPLAIDGALESATLRLQDRLKELSASDEVTVVPQTMVDPSISYYNEHADEYAAQTRFVDLTDLYNRFRKMVPQGGRILDAGCGVGRDTRYFIEHGYPVVSIDASKEMVRKCREYPHAYCLWMPFENLSFQGTFDAVWACASLLHMPLGRTREALSKLTTTLKPGGVMFISVRQPVIGKSSDTVGGRFYEYYDEAKLRELIAAESRLEITEIWGSASNMKEDSGQWINALLRRKRDVAKVTS